MSRQRFVFALALGLVGCGTDEVVMTIDAGGNADSSVHDLGATDQGMADSGVADSGVADSGMVDSGMADSGVVDSGPLAAIVLSSTSGLMTSEAGASATFTVSLATEPTGNVVLGVASSNIAEGAATPASLTFSPANWSTPQTVYVAGVNDSEADGPQEYEVIVSVTASSDSAYAALAETHVGVTNVDNDTPGVMITPMTGLLTTESGETATASISLLTAPTANVTIAFTSNDISEGSVTPASLTFTPANWSTPQTITVTGVDDAIQDGATAYLIATDPAVSTDLAYSGLNGVDIPAQNADNEIVPSAQSAYVKGPYNESGDTFGFASRVSADGNTMVVSAYGESSNAVGIGGDGTNNAAVASGAVFVYVRDVGPWTLQAYIKASNAEAHDTFGYSLAISGDGNTVAVFANDEASAATGIDGNQADNSAVQAGAVYVFARSGATWAQQAYVKSSNMESNDVFGRSLSLSADGNRMVIAASSESSAATGIDGNQADNSALYSGAVYSFARTGSTWVQDAYIKASNTDTADLFGTYSALSEDGTVLVVSSWTEDSAATGVGGNQADNTAPGTGAVYVFRHSGSGWAQEAYIKASNSQAMDQFGWGVAISGDGATIAVGASGEDSSATGVGGDQTSNASANAGAVYIFTHSGGSWVQQSYLKASNTDAGDNFGTDLSLSSDGNTLVVGSPHEASNATGAGGDEANNASANAGAFYIFNRGGGTWAQNAYVKASNTDAGDNFAYHLSIAGDGHTVVVGAYGEASNATGIGGDQADDSASYAGALYVFDAP